MSKVYYDETTLQKREMLATYIEAIESSLAKIGEVNISNCWVCIEGDKLGSKVETLQDKIGSIKSGLNSYDSFLGLTDRTYKDVSQDVTAALTSYLQK